MGKQKYHRRQYIINPHFQLKISGIIVGTLLLATFITAIFLYMNILNSVLPEFSADKLEEKIETANYLKQRQHAQYQQQAEDGRMLDLIFPESSEMLASYERGVVINVLHRVNRNLIPWIMVLVALILAAGIFLTHRIAGPVYNFKKSFEQINKGDLTKRIYLRWSDEFKDLAENINECLATLDTSTSQFKSDAKNLRNLSADLEMAVKKQDTKETEDLLDKLEKLIEKLNSELIYYQTTEKESESA
jgi:methyl-accepting chemotaxis protein